MPFLFLAFTSLRAAPFSVPSESDQLRRGSAAREAGRLRHDPLRLVGQERHEVPVEVGLEELVEAVGVELHHGLDHDALAGGVGHAVAHPHQLLLVAAADPRVEEVALGAPEHEPWGMGGAG